MTLSANMIFFNSNQNDQFDCVSNFQSEQDHHQIGRFSVKMFDRWSNEVSFV
jgi:hypothetical protein